MANLFPAWLLPLFCLATLRNVQAYPTNGNPVQCGEVLGRSSRIVNGSVANQLHFPSIASIKQFGVHTCGGTIISGRYILSAGHCQIQANEDWSVTLGEYNLAEEESFSASYQISKVILFPGYGHKNLMDNDIVLLRLSEDIEWSHHIQPICLPTENTGTHTDAIAPGWGYDDSSQATGVSNTKLRFVKLDIFENELCDRIYLERNLELSLKLTQLCAGRLDGGIDDTSSGDSGGPLLLELGGKQVLVGVTSRSTPETGYPRAPGIYSRVFEYMSWIMETIGQVDYYPESVSSHNRLD